MDERAGGRICFRRLWTHSRLVGANYYFRSRGAERLQSYCGGDSEYVPLVHIVGAPKMMDQKSHKIMHHTLLNGDFDVFRQMYTHLCSYTAIVTPENAEQEIPTAIRIAKQKRKPVYLMVADDLVTKPIVRRVVPEEKKITTNKPALKAAI